MLTAVEACVSKLRVSFILGIEEGLIWAKAVEDLKILLADPELQMHAASWPESLVVEGKPGNLLFYEDPDFGFVINALIKAPGRATSVHDHGKTWTLYGVLQGGETVCRFERRSSDSQTPGLADLVETSSQVVLPGAVDFCRPWDIHQERNHDLRTVGLIIRSQRSGTFVQNKFDVTSGKVEQYGGPAQIPYSLTWPNEPRVEPQQPVNRKPHHGVPVIDFSAFTFGGTLTEKRCCAEEIRFACRSAGFFVLINHGVPTAAFENAILSSKDFFADVPQSEKVLCANGYSSGYALRKKGIADSVIAERFTCHAHDLHGKVPDGQYYDNEFAKLIFHKPVSFPKDAAPQFRNALGVYNDEMRRLTVLIWRALAMALSLPETFFTDQSNRDISRLVAAHYLPQSAEGMQDRFQAHTDITAFTCVMGKQPGLQVRQADGTWLDAPVGADHVCINIGDMLERWTSGCFRSCTHRVIGSLDDRLSLVYFVNPDYDCIMDGSDISSCGPTSCPPIAVADMCFMGVVWKMSHFGKLPWTEGLRRYNQDVLESSYAKKADSQQSVLERLQISCASKRQRIGGA
jgi:isopenicillin N synthase-like dioxygenase